MRILQDPIRCFKSLLNDLKSVQMENSTSESVNLTWLIWLEVKDLQRLKPKVSD